MSGDPYSILEVSRHATEAEIERAYERLLNLFDPERYPGSTEDAYRRLADVNAAYAEIRGGEALEAAEPKPAAPEATDPDDSEPTDEPARDGRRADVAANLVRIGFLSGDAPQTDNPAVEVLATLLPSSAEIGVCLTCLGVKSTGEYKCRETSGRFRAMTFTRRDEPYAGGGSVRPIARTEIVLCTHEELSWTASQYGGERRDNVTLYSIPFDDILGASVRGRRRDDVEVWIADGLTVSVHTRPHEGEDLCRYIERIAASG